MPGIVIDDYNDTHRAFVQALLARNTLTLATAQPILAAIESVYDGRTISPNDITVEDLNSFVSVCNSSLSPLDLEIRSTFHQHTRERHYALVNTTSDPLTQLATTYDADEIAFVKRLLDAMFEKNNRPRTEAMCVSGIEAVQLARAAGRRETQNGNTSQPANQGLSLREGEAMLGKLVDEGWLEKSQKGFYSLSPRSLMELKGWLVETYNEPAEEGEPRRNKLKFCHACKEIITVGQRCPRRECPCRLHNICTTNFFRMQRNEAKCPICKTEWDGKSYVGEKAITTSQDYNRSKRSSMATTARDVASEDEDEADEDT